MTVYILKFMLNIIHCIGCTTSLAFNMKLTILPKPVYPLAHVGANRTSVQVWSPVRQVGLGSPRNQHWKWHMGLSCSYAAILLFLKELRRGTYLNDNQVHPLVRELLVICCPVRVAVLPEMSHMVVIWTCAAVLLFQGTKKNHLNGSVVHPLAHVGCWRN